jgi:photosystem II stability/assembly factor-like uncharacterized protein
MNGSRRAGALIAVATLALAVAWYLQVWPWTPAKPWPSPSPPQGFFGQIVRWDFASFTTGWAEVRRPSGIVELYATSDAGRSWILLKAPFSDSSNFYDLQAMNSSNLLATTSWPDALWWSYDGGKSWGNRSPRSLNPVGGAERSRLGHFFLDIRHGWLLDSSLTNLADQPSVLWATNDAGVSWREVWRLDPRAPEFAGMLRQGIHIALSFRDSTNGWLGIRFLDESRLYRTDDGGRNWRLVELPLSRPPGLIFFVAHARDGALILITSDGQQAMAIASRDGGDHWESPRPLPDPLGRGTPFRPALLDHDHWLLALGDEFFVTDNSGRTWTSFRPTVPPGHRLKTEVWFADRLHGWAPAGDFMLRTDDGGHSWKLAGPP